MTRSMLTGPSQQNEVQAHLEEVDPNEGAFPPERKLAVSLMPSFNLPSAPSHSIGAAIL